MTTTVQTGSQKIESRIGTLEFTHDLRLSHRCNRRGAL
jgi:hypothetical protein